MKLTINDAARNYIFFGWLTLTTLIGTPLYIIYHGVSAVALILFFFMLIATLTSITSGYHRLFAHRTYKTKGWVKFLFLVFGAAAFQESCLRWASEHRVHHAHVDHDEDPYNIKKGFWWAHMGWIFDVNGPRVEEPKDLKEDKLVMWQYRNWVWVGIVVSFIFPALIGLAFGDLIGGLLLGGIVRLTLAHHLTFFINSLAHTVGKQEYCTTNTAGDCWWLAFFTFGEGFHNFHHRFPSDYRNGIKFYHFDPGKWLITTLRYFGLAWDVKQTPNAVILRNKIRARHERMNRHQPQELKKQAKEALNKLLEKVDEFYARKREWVIAKRQSVQDFKEDEIVALKQTMLEAKRQYREAYREWQRIIEANKPFRKTATS